jgi:hypothetical protein
MEKLLNRRNRLNEIRHGLNADADLQSAEGTAYIRTLTLLVIVQMQIDEKEKVVRREDETTRN